MPVIKGETTVRERERLFEAFRTGEVDHAGRVARWRTSPSTCRRRRWRSRCRGPFGSRQEEAQRLGRILRPKADGRTARFYAVVARDTVDADFAAHRQRFLAEQGYAYRIVDADDL